MCYSVLNELMQVKELEDSKKIKLPRATYFFVQKYGRSMVEEMAEIAKVIGNGSWFTFLTEGKKKDVTMLGRFLMELEKNAEIGKMFQGAVLVELTGEEEEKELSELLGYIKQNARQFGCVFTTNALDKAEEVEERLEQYFFLRRINGQQYDSEEQKGLFLQVLEEYGFETDHLGQEVKGLFSELCWNEADMVQNRIENLARNLVYDKMLNPEELPFVSVEEVKNLTAELKKEPEKKRQIGFV